MTTVFLVRHAAHDRVHDTLCGRMPGVALGEAGRAQAARLGERFAAEAAAGAGIAVLHTSPVQRARETAAPMAARLGLAAAPCPAIEEIDFGTWTGRRFAELDGDPEWCRWNAARGSARPPGGEAMAAVQARAVAHVESLRTLPGNGAAVLVSHGDVIRAVLCAYLGLGLDLFWRLEVGPASTSVLQLRPEGGATLLGLNQPV